MCDASGSQLWRSLRRAEGAVGGEGDVPGPAELHQVALHKVGMQLHLEVSQNQTKGEMSLVQVTEAQHANLTALSHVCDASANFDHTEK